jgi:hypothetical protein
MEVKFNLDDKNGNIKDFTISGTPGDLSSEAFGRIIRSIKDNLRSDTAQTKVSSVSKDITDLSSDKLTIKERLKLFLKFEYRGRWFTSLDVKERYERQYNEEIKISTVSTYLSRLNNEGFLQKRGNRVEREYMIVDITDDNDPISSVEKSGVMPPMR